MRYIQRDIVFIKDLDHCTEAVRRQWVFTLPGKGCLVGTSDVHKAFHLSVIRIEVFITQGPVHGYSVTRLHFEV